MKSCVISTDIYIVLNSNLSVLKYIFNVNYKHGVVISLQHAPPSHISIQ